MTREYLLDCKLNSLNFAKLILYSKFHVTRVRTNDRKSTISNNPFHRNIISFTCLSHRQQRIGIEYLEFNRTLVQFRIYRSCSVKRQQP